MALYGRVGVPRGLFAADQRARFRPSNRLVGAEMISTRMIEGVAEVVMDVPPVNALPVKGWYALAEAIDVHGADSHIRAVVLRAVSRGFNAGVDIKEIQRDTGHTALVGAIRTCIEAPVVVY